jgi:hypothetical protein
VGGEQELNMAYNLPDGANQAVRVQFRYGGSIGSCTSGSYNDRDDLVFAVVSVHEPTPSPVMSSPPTENVGGGPQQASYDSDLTVPRCNVFGSECDSLNLLNGRGFINNGNEPNAPNTLDSCVDGNTGSYHSDESIDRIIVRSGEVDDSGSGPEFDMMEGGRATIIATVYAWNTGSSDHADFYYASDASNPNWVLIESVTTPQGGLQELKVAYDLPSGTNQAVRVNFRYSGTPGTNGACSGGSYDDTDDLAFRVRSNPSFTMLTANPNSTDEENKDTSVDQQRRDAINFNKRGKKTSGKAGKRAKKE